MTQGRNESKSVQTCVFVFIRNCLPPLMCHNSPNASVWFPSVDQQMSASQMAAKLCYSPQKNSPFFLLFFWHAFISAPHTHAPPHRVCWALYESVSREAVYLGAIENDHQTQRRGNLIHSLLIQKCSPHSAALSPWPAKWNDVFLSVPLGMHQMKPGN